MITIHNVPGGASFAIKVHPRAKMNAITGELGNVLKLALAAPPDASEDARRVQRQAVGLHIAPLLQRALEGLLQPITRCVDSGEQGDSDCRPHGGGGRTPIGYLIWLGG